MSSVARKRSTIAAKSHFRPPPEVLARQRVVVTRSMLETCASHVLNIHPPTPAQAHDRWRIHAQAAQSPGRNGVVALMMYFLKLIADARSIARRCASTTSSIATRRNRYRSPALSSARTFALPIVVPSENREVLSTTDATPSLGGEQLAEVLGRGFGDAVNVLRRARRPHGSRPPADPGCFSASPNVLVVEVMTKVRTRARTPRAGSARRERWSRQKPRRMGCDMGFVGRNMHHRQHPAGCGRPDASAIDPMASVNSPGMISRPRAARPEARKVRMSASPRCPELPVTSTVILASALV